MSETFVKIRPDEGGVWIDWNYSLYRYRAHQGPYTYFIPGFNIMFTVKDESRKNVVAERLTRAFFNSYMENPKSGLKKLALALHSLGFRTAKNDNLTMKQLMQNELQGQTTFKGRDRGNLEDYTESGSLAGHLKAA